jgi:hypothetical protein
MADSMECPDGKLAVYAIDPWATRSVRNALSSPWSNGPTEGHINRLKFIKRQMYGRANFDLLRRRVLGFPAAPSPF